MAHKNFAQGKKHTRPIIIPYFPEKFLHYRDSEGLECDAIVHLRDGSYGLIEIKIGGESLINDGAEALIKLRDKIDTTKMKKPSFLMVLIGIGELAYRRDDGVYVVPLGSLKD